MTDASRLTLNKLRAAYGIAPLEGVGGGQRTAEQQMALDHPTPREVRRLRARVSALETFADRVIACSRGGGDADGGDIQEWALEAGLLVRVEVTEPCGENCFCAEWDDFPQTCIRRREAE